MATGDEPTNWELQRNYEALRKDVQTGFQQLNNRLDQMPTTAVLNSLSKDQGKLETRMDREEERRTADRRLVWGALLAALGSIAATLASRALGG